MKILPAAMIAISTCCTQLAADDREAKPSKGKFTLGGKQFWGDVHHFRGWRIQKNTFTGHHRLLDPKDRRHTWGKYDKCLVALKEQIKKHGLKPLTKPVVVLIPGIARSSKVMKTYATAAKEVGYETVLFDYPSTREGIIDHAKYLRDVISRLSGPKKIYIVAHSMGGLVSRTYLAGKVGKPDKRITRLVMVGTPNKGAKMANLVKDWALYQLVWGKSGQQLINGKGAFVNKLAKPPVEFAIIAGGRGNNTGYNPLIPGDDDGLVEVESARLDGAADYAFFKTHHGGLLRKEAVAVAAVRFLKTGALRENGKKQPIQKVMK